MTTTLNTLQPSSQAIRAASEHTPNLPLRLDLYAGIHKTLRAWMFDTLVALGRVDGSDAQALQGALQKTEALLAVCGQHIAHENAFLHTQLEQDTPGSSHEADVAHQGHRRHIVRLEAMMLRVRTEAPGPLRFAALTTLYRELALFVAENLEHMQWEETVHNEALWARHTDAELDAIHDALVQTIPPQEMAEVLRHMLPALSPLERHGMLADMRSKMPPQAFDGVLQLAHEVLGAHCWAALQRELGLQIDVPSGRLMAC